MRQDDILKSIENNNTMSFYNFITDNYVLSPFILPNKRPLNDSLDNREMEKLMELMREKDYYEINQIITKRYEY